MTKTLVSDVDITLNGDTYTLRPSLKAATAISRQFGGFIGAYQQLAAGNLEAFQFIIRNAITSKNISTQDLNEAVWQTGISKLSSPVSKFISILQNGGRDPDEGNDDDEDESGDGAGNGEI